MLDVFRFSIDDWLHRILQDQLLSLVPAWVSEWAWDGRKQGQRVGGAFVEDGFATLASY